MAHSENVKTTEVKSAPSKDEDVEMNDCEDPVKLQEALDEAIAMSHTGEKIGIRNQILVSEDSFGFVDRH